MERERADEVAVAEEVDGIEAVLYLLYGPITGAIVVLSTILDGLHEAIVDFLILKGEEVLIVLSEQVADGVRDTCVEILQTRRTSDILRNDEVELQFAYLSGHAGLLVAFVESRDGTGGHFEHGGTGDGLRELRVES